MSLGFASLTLALALGPSVAVEVAPGTVSENVDAQDAQALRGWLVERLIEEGFTIAPADQADAVLVLRTDPGEMLMLEAAGERFEIEPGPAAVMRLEALHRARIVLEHSEPHPEPATAAPAAILGFRSSTEAPEGAAGVLESALLVEGFVLTPRPRAEDPVLCVVHGNEMLAASVTRGAEACPDPTVRLAYAEMTRPGGVDAIVALLGALDHGPAEPLAAPPVAPVSAAQPAPSLPITRVEPEEIRKPAEFRLGLDAGLSVRGAPDASLRAFSRLGRRHGLGGRLQVSLTPSSQDGLRAVDTVLATGPDVRLGRRRFSFHAGTVAGARVHAFYYDTTRGGSVDWYVGIPAGVSFGKPDGARVHLLTEAFATGNSLEHRRTNAEDWTRTAWGVRLALGFSFGWRIL